MRKIIFVLALVLFFCASIFITYRISYRRGFVDRELLVIPGQLILQLQMYSMRTNLPENVSGILSEGSIKLGLYGTLYPLNHNYNRVLKLQQYKNGIIFNQESFDRNIDIAKEIIKDLEIVSLGEVLEPLMDKSQ